MLPQLKVPIQNRSWRIEKMIHNQQEYWTSPALERKSENHITHTRSKDLQLRFSDKISIPVFTKESIKGENCVPLKVALVDNHSGEVVSYGPEASAKVQIVVLKADIDGGLGSSWTPEEFKNKIVTKEGKGKLLTGNVVVNLKEGICFIDTVYFSQTRIWKNKHEYRLGVMVDNDSIENKISEGITEPFYVKDRRLLYEMKHYPPKPSSEVWRLKGIARRGRFHQRLSNLNINTVGDFLKELNANPQNLQDILCKSMSHKSWEGLTSHAYTCISDERVQFCSSVSQQKTKALSDKAAELEVIKMQYTQPCRKLVLEPSIVSVVKEPELAPGPVKRRRGKEIQSTEETVSDHTDGIGLPGGFSSMDNSSWAQSSRSSLGESADNFDGISVREVETQVDNFDGISVREAEIQVDNFDGISVREVENKVDNFDGISVREVETKADNFDGISVREVETQVDNFDGISVREVETQVDNFDGISVREVETKVDNFDGISVREVETQVDNFDGISVREVETNAFIVSDLHGESWRKHHPPSLHDEVWRLENVGKCGAIYEHLCREKVNTVKDFLTLLFLDPARLRNFLGVYMSLEMCEVTIEHARTCVLEANLYFYCPSISQQKSVAFNIVGQLYAFGLFSNDQHTLFDELSEAEKDEAHNMVIDAFKNWGQVKTFDNNAPQLTGSSHLFTNDLYPNPAKVNYLRTTS